MVKHSAVAVTEIEAQDTRQWASNSLMLVFLFDYIIVTTDDRSSIHQAASERNRNCPKDAETMLRYAFLILESMLDPAIYASRFPQTPMTDSHTMLPIDHGTISTLGILDNSLDSIRLLVLEEKCRQQRHARREQQA